jgi:predicted Fe-S protein YdhL (DUF1289 family)
MIPAATDSEHESLCEGCSRSTEEIIEWRSYSPQERMEIQEELSDRDFKRLRADK